MTVLIIILIVILFLLLLPLRFHVRVSVDAIKVSVFGIKVVRRSLLPSYRATSRKVKKAPRINLLRLHYLNLYKSLHFRLLHLSLEGIGLDDYAQGALALGPLGAIGQALMILGRERKLPLTYEIHIEGGLGGRIESIFWLVPGKILYHYLILRRQINGKRTTN